MVVPGQKSYEVPQSGLNHARALKDFFKLFKSYEKKINKVSKKVREAFTRNNFFNTHIAKQTSLCTDCHLTVHASKYDGPSLQKLPRYIFSDFDE